MCFAIPPNWSTSRLVAHLRKLLAERKARDIAAISGTLAGMVELGGFGSEAKFKCFPFVDGSEIRRINRLKW